jgi:hypothetical protein
MSTSIWINRARVCVAGALLALLAACGGGGGDDAAPPPPPAVDPLLVLGDAGPATVLNAVPPPAAASAPDGTATTLTVHYQRTAGDYTGWQIHSFNAAVDPGWNNGHNVSRTDAFGAVYEVPLVSQSGTVGYLFHKQDDKDHGGADQSYVLKPGKNEIWRIQGDGATYTSNPAGVAAPDIDTVRVHYRRYANDYAGWGLHLWASNGIDAARLPAGVAIDQWGNAVGFDQMPGYSAGAAEVVFDIPVLNPKDDANRKSLEFIIHGKSPNENDKDGRSDNIRVDYAALTINGRVGEIWLVQQDATVYTTVPDLRSASTTDARPLHQRLGQVLSLGHRPDPRAQGRRR